MTGGVRALVRGGRAWWCGAAAFASTTTLEAFRINEKRQYTHPVQITNSQRQRPTAASKHEAEGKKRKHKQPARTCDDFTPWIFKSDLSPLLSVAVKSAAPVLPMCITRLRSAPLHSVDREKSSSECVQPEQRAHEGMWSIATSAGGTGEMES